MNSAVVWSYLLMGVMQWTNSRASSYMKTAVALDSRSQTPCHSQVNNLFLEKIIEIDAPCTSHHLYHVKNDMMYRYLCCELYNDTRCTNPVDSPKFNVDYLGLAILRDRMDSRCQLLVDDGPMRTMHTMGREMDRLNALIGSIEHRLDCDCNGTKGITILTNTINEVANVINQTVRFYVIKACESSLYSVGVCHNDRHVTKDEHRNGYFGCNTGTLDYWPPFINGDNRRCSSGDFNSKIILDTANSLDNRNMPCVSNRRCMDHSCIVYADFVSVDTQMYSSR